METFILLQWEMDNQLRNLNEIGPGMVIYFCNVSYSGGRDREDRCPRPAQVGMVALPL
jgi:hypothetical protein